MTLRGLTFQWRYHHSLQLCKKWADCWTLFDTEHDLRTMLLYTEVMLAVKIKKAIQWTKISYDLKLYACISVSLLHSQNMIMYQCLHQSSRLNAVLSEQKDYGRYLVSLVVWVLIHFKTCFVAQSRYLHFNLHPALHIGVELPYCTLRSWFVSD